MLVPKSGPDGNDLGTLLPPEVAVPLATYTGWNLRRRDVGAEGMLASLMGSYIPLPADPGRAAGDRRPARVDRGAVRELRGVPEAVRGGVRRPARPEYLLKEDAERLLKDREKRRELFPAPGK